MTEYRYRCTHVVTTDYGDGPAAGSTSTAHLAIIPDGSPWHARPATLAVDVPIGTRPGDEYRVTIAKMGG